MSDFKGTTRAQTLFLRAFAKDPYGPPPRDWPSPVVLRRWLKRPGFCGAMHSILRALRYQADFHLTAAAASAAHLLHGTVMGGEIEGVRKPIESLVHLLRMSHIRHRFAEPLPVPPPRESQLIEILRMAHPSITVAQALECTDHLDASARVLGPNEAGYGYKTWKKTGHPFSADFTPDPARHPDYPEYAVQAEARAAEARAERQTTERERLDEEDRRTLERRLGRHRDNGDCDHDDRDQGHDHDHDHDAG